MFYEIKEPTTEISSFFKVTMPTEGKPIYCHLHKGDGIFIRCSEKYKKGDSLAKYPNFVIKQIIYTSYPKWWQFWKFFNREIFGYELEYVGE